MVHRDRAAVALFHFHSLYFSFCHPSPSPSSTLFSLPHHTYRHTRTHSHCPVSLVDLACHQYKTPFSRLLHTRRTERTLRGFCREKLLRKKCEREQDASRHRALDTDRDMLTYSAEMISCLRDSQTERKFIDND